MDETYIYFNPPLLKVEIRPYTRATIITDRQTATTNFNNIQEQSKVLGFLFLEMFGLAVVRVIRNKIKASIAGGNEVE